MDCNIWEKEARKKIKKERKKKLIEKTYVQCREKKERKKERHIVKQMQLSLTRSK